MGFMLKAVKHSVAVGALLLTTSAFAADPFEPQVVEMPPYQPPQVVEKQVSTGNWYLRGDAGYHWSELRGIHYYTAPPIQAQTFATHELKGAFSIGGGVGYKINKHFRTDLTADYWLKADFTGSTDNGTQVSVDTTSYSALLLLANAYVDLGTYAGITPYVGAGIGGAYVKWDDLANTIGTTTTYHEGNAEWRFAWALMAGASYCVTDSLELDAGYRYANISGGQMFGIAQGAGPGYDEGMHVHEARAGIRYALGGQGSANCVKPQVVSYEPPSFDPPVYK
ncbi:outer membrane protein [Nitratireductor sp. CH_MIT9313-5]|uniref:outer membrane protein n=1 Tax=Nitratireductor sp. CH_MIT9313-5 TaxID=3107764 RepID=UPI003FA54C85